MNRPGTYLLPLALLACLGGSWLVVVGGPWAQLGELAPLPVTGMAGGYPEPLTALAEEGRRVYAAENCAACHTQQLGAGDVAPATARGWGERRTVPRDFLQDRPAFPGALRIGPDLTNLARREASAEVLYLHLYAPRAVVEGSTMPPYRFLFQKHRNAGAPSTEALRLAPPFAPPPGVEVAPRPGARALVAYLLSLDHSAPLPEAKP